MTEIPAQTEALKKTLNPKFKDFFHQVFANISPSERTKFLIHDFNTLISPIGIGVDLAIEGMKLGKATEIKAETAKIRAKAHSGDLSNLTDFLRSIDTIVDLTKDVDSHGDEFISKYLKNVPIDRRVIKSFIDVIRFLKNPSEILWKRVQESSTTMRTVLKDNFPKYHANISLDSAQAVILHNVYSKFSDYFKNIEVKVEEDGRMTFTGLLKYPNKPAVFERYENPFEKRSIPTRDEILNNNGINFSNGLFMAELLCLASNREMTIKYMGDNATVQIL